MVIGAGPVGLAAAAHLAERGLDFLVLEAGRQVGASVARWGHVRVFSPWKYNIDAAARRLLTAAGWTEPDPEWLPTGAELIGDYLAPLAKTFGERVRLGTRVTAISRLGYDRVRTTGREQAPFLIHLADGQEITARAVVDASGTYTTPNVLGASGLPAQGEQTISMDRNRFGSPVSICCAGHRSGVTLLSAVIAVLLLGIVATKDHAMAVLISRRHIC
ncbi:FAD-dependent oxidoreductase [Streptosporangium soli]|nr:FAD-dependent oxidoreductase [Streptosporangium sp. KLBMP 9127]